MTDSTRFRGLIDIRNLFANEYRRYEQLAQLKVWKQLLNV